jgi:hypothetical protein
MLSLTKTRITFDIFFGNYARIEMIGNNINHRNNNEDKEVN